jgi:hypothetical protein
LDKRDGANDYFITWSGVSAVTLDESNAAAVGTTVSTTQVKNIGTPLRINGNGGPDSVQIDDAGSPVFVNTGLGDTDSLIVNGDLDSVPVTVVVDQSDDVENLVIFDQGTLRIPTGAVLLKTRLTAMPTLTMNGVLDLAGGAFISRLGGPSQATFRSQIIFGRNGGAWNGTATSGAINSSLAASTPIGDAVGYGLGSDVAVTSSGPFSIAPGDTFIRYTLEGDANLDARVDNVDLGILSLHFQTAATAWTSADFDYNGLVNVDDMDKLAKNFGQQLPVPLAKFGIAGSIEAERSGRIALQVL